MTDTDPARQRAASAAALPATQAAVPATRDAHGFDPADYDWVPVRRQPRPDGWSAEKQRLFIETLADTGSVSAAAREVGKSPKSAYELRRAADGAGFARAWTAAVRQGMNRLLDVCLQRAMEGSEDAIFDREGQVIGHRLRHHDRMAMFLLRAHMPDLFRPDTAGARRTDRARGESMPPVPEPVAEAVKAIDPVPPPAPHALMPPDELANALATADIMEGALPRWRRDPELVAAEAERARDRDDTADPEEYEHRYAAEADPPPRTPRRRRA